MASPPSVPDGFHFETRFVVLSVLRLSPVRDSETDERRRVKDEIEDELRRLDDDITSSSSGFDRRSSLVFNPLDPDSSIEDCLAAMGDRVARDLGLVLTVAVDSLLSGPLDYERFRDASRDLTAHTHGGWSQVLVPLVLIQSLQSEGRPVTSLLQLGLRLLEEEEADFIIQQGGWGEIFRLQSEDDRVESVADDSNDIYILSADQHVDRSSPPSSLSADPSSWRTDSLPVSWVQVGSMEPEDAKSLDGAEAAALSEENNSSNSDIVHVEREEAELLDEGGEAAPIDDSVMSVLGSDSELAELRDQVLDEVQDPTAAKAPPPAISEEPVVIETPCLSAEPSLVSDPELPPPPAEPEPAEPEEPEPAEPSSVKEPEPEPEPDQDPEPIAGPPQPEPHTGEDPALDPVPVPAPVAADVPVKSEEQPSELQTLLYGGAALAILAVMAYGVLSCRRK